MSTLEDLPQPEFEGTVPPEELEVDGENPNEQNEDTFGLLCENMREKGWLGNAIVTDTDGLIADGEHRWRAAKEIGLDEVPVKQYDIDDSERRLWRQELNKISGEHDKKRDALEYDTLIDAGKKDDVINLTNAADEDLDELLDSIRIDKPANPNYEYDPEHNVYFEDCVKGMQTRLDDDSVDCVITDPPYGIEYDASMHVGIDDGDNYSSSIENDGLEDSLVLWREFLLQVKRVLKPNGHVYTFTPLKELPRFQEIVESVLDFQNKVVWVKNNHTVSPDSQHNFGYKYEELLFATNPEGEPKHLTEFATNVMEYDRPSSGKYDHPTQKPEPLITKLVELSTQPGGTVLDPFMGSGTTAVAAIQNDRDYIGFELDEDNYRDVIERRIGEAKRQADAAQNTT